MKRNFNYQKEIFCQWVRCLNNIDILLNFSFITNIISILLHTESEFVVEL